MPRPVITLCTDFGLQDGFVGEMKGVILSICPEAAVVDITHQIEPQGIRQAAFILASVTPYFPRFTVHLVVVDPGVGSGRRPIAVMTERATYIAPDNGVLGIVLAQQPASLAIHLTNPAYFLSPISATFHGRDVFAPAAAHLASGLDPHQMGEMIPPSDLVTLSLSLPVPHGPGTWKGEILHTDRFGNLVTSFRCIGQNVECYLGDSTSGDGAPQVSVTVGGERITGLSRTFADVDPGELVAYIGSSGYLEVARREGSAAEHLGVQIRDPVWLELPTASLPSDPHQIDTPLSVGIHPAGSARKTHA